MRCLHCGFESPCATRFCGGCGEPTSPVCAACGAANPPGFRFCGNCGTRLDPHATSGETDVGSGANESSSATPSAAPPTGDSERPAERRQLTVMFCDLVGSTSLSALLDPEELREVVRAYQTIAAEVIERYEGYIAQYLGDGILAYFGYPRSLEDEAGRAVRAARELVAAIRRLNAQVSRPGDFTLSARVGIHTGVVVIGEIGGGRRREHLALGETPNVAARIQAFAEPDQVVVSGETYRLVRGDFAFEPLAPREIRGIAEPIELYRADGDQALELARVGRGSASLPLLGRDSEIARLESEWRAASSGAGRVVLLVGDTGLGKTALARAFGRSVASTGTLVLSGRALPYLGSSPLEPMAELMRRWLDAGNRSEVNGDSASPRDRLRALLAGVGMEGDLPLFASLLGLRNRDREALAATPEPQWRERTGAALSELLLRTARERPLVVCLEDIHWADPSTLELLGELVARIPGRPMLALLTHRPGFDPPWEAPEHQSELPLGRLNPAESEALIAQVTDGRPLPPELVSRILERTDGVPFFVEELTRMVMESGLVRQRDGRWELVSEDLPPLAIPLTLHDSLEARLERLGPLKETAQLGAVLGREFGFDLIQAVTEQDEESLTESLERLVDADLLVRSGGGASAIYAFKHGLIQEVAYQSLLRGVRQTHHLRVARVLETGFADRAAEKPEILAQHYAGAGMPERAVEHWTRAGCRALERSASREAVLHLRHGMDLLHRIAEGDARRDLELELLLTLGPALIATQGHASTAVRDTYARAHELAGDDADIGRRSEILTGLVTAYLVRGEMEEARTAAEEMLSLARAVADPGREMAATVALGTALLAGGRVEEGLRRLEEAIAGYSAERDFPLTHRAGQDFGVVARVYSGYALCALAEPSRAAERSQEAIELARSLRHPSSLAFALSFACSIAYFRGDPNGAAAPLAELIALSRSERFPHWLLATAPVEAWLRVERGETEAALAVLARSEEALSGSRADIQVLFWRFIAAETYLRAARPERALRLLNETIETMVARPTRLWWTAEALRVRAQVQAFRGDSEQALADLARAASEASGAGAKLFLLRAHLDRARLFPAESAGADSLRELARLAPELPDQGLPELQAARALIAASAEMRESG